MKTLGAAVAGAAHLVASAAVLGALMIGCSGPTSHPESNTSQTTDRPRVALVMKSLANEFFKTMSDGARAHQEANSQSYDLLAMGIKDELDVGAQIRRVEQAIAEGVAALVIAPADSKALVSVCQRAQQAGIVVVNIDNRLDVGVLAERGMTVPFVGPDNAAGARLVGDYLASQLTTGAKVAILEGVPSAFNAVERPVGDLQGQPGRRGVDLRDPRSRGLPLSKRQHGTGRGRSAQGGRQDR